VLGRLSARRSREDDANRTRWSALGLVGGAGIVAYVAFGRAIVGMTKTAARERVA